MKFSTSTIAALATVAAFTSTPANAFSVGTHTGHKFNPFGLQGLAKTAEVPQLARSSLNSALSATNTPVDEVQKLKEMAAKLREEASELEEQQMSERRQAIEKQFNKFDTNKDGELSLDELKAALEKTFKLAVPEDKVQRLMEDFDTSGDGKLQKDEFVSIQQLGSRLDSIVNQEKQKARDEAKAAQKEAEVAQLIESQLELINDREPTNTDKLVSVLPYLFPLMDGLLFGQFLLAGNESNPVVAVLALLYTVYRSIPLSGFLSFFALNAVSNNPSINRLVRYNAQQAVFLDVALFIPGLIAALTGAASSGLGVSIPPMVGELSSDALFVALIATLGYSTVSSLLGQTPDKIPFLSESVNNRVPRADDLDIIDFTTGEPIIRNKKTENDDKNKSQD